MDITINLDYKTRATLISRAVESDAWTTIDTYSSETNTCYEFYSASKGIALIINDGDDPFFNDVVIA